MAVLPTIRMVSPRLGEVIVNLQDRDDLLAQGWTMPGAEPKAPETPAPSGDSTEVSRKQREAQLVKLNVPELQDRAAGLEGIADPRALKKRDLIEAILSVEFDEKVPEAAGEEPDAPEE